MPPGPPFTRIFSRKTTIRFPSSAGPYLDGWSYEEWFGIVSQGSGKGSPFARILRPAYYRMKEFWNAK